MRHHAGGLSYQWYRNTICRGEDLRAAESGRSVYALLDEEAEQARPGAGGVLYLPYLVGERSPLWNLDARGAFIGLHAATTRGEMTRAVLEGVGFNLKLILDVFESERSLDSIVMIGGGAKGHVWLQILADIWQKTLYVPALMEEATSMGAAICGGVGIGLYGSFESCNTLNPPIREIRPNSANQAVYGSLYTVFQKTYESLVPTYSMLANHNQIY